MECYASWCYTETIIRAKQVMPFHGNKRIDGRVWYSNGPTSHEIIDG